jgi:beta-lactamase class D
MTHGATPALAWWVALFALTAPGAAAAQRPDGGPAPLPEGVVVDLSARFEGVEEATAVVLRADGVVVRYRPERAAQRLIPASTFKIPNTVIALETEVADGPGFALPWDSTRVPRADFFPAAWARDQDLASAFRNSVVWYYQEMARRVGERRMAGWLGRLGYGNRAMGVVDRFWLDGPLAISAEEQVRFLRRLLEGELPVAAATLATLRELALLAEGAGWRLYGKTGTSEVTATRENGWIVGWLERDSGADYYAINIEGERVWEEWPPPRRHELALQVLRDAGSLPAR